MGDFILTLPVIDNLKLQYPDARIDMMVRPYIKDLVLSTGKIDKVIAYDTFFSAVNEISKEGYDIAIDMIYDYRLDSALLAYMSGAPVRAGFSGGFRQILFNYAVSVAKDSKKSMLELNLELLRPLGIPVVVTVPRLTLKVNNAKKDIIAIHPGGYYESQRWSEYNFISLSKKILEKHQFSLVIIGAESERALVDRIVKSIDSPRVKALLLPMNELIQALSVCRLLVCNNSGPLHLAAALDVPTVSMMGPTDPNLWQPQGENNIVLRKNPGCSPCTLGKCAHHTCMNSITVEGVFDALNYMLDKLYGTTK